MLLGLWFLKYFWLFTWTVSVVFLHRTWMVRELMRTYSLIHKTSELVNRLWKIRLLWLSLLKTKLKCRETKVLWKISIKIKEEVFQYIDTHVGRYPKTNNHTLRSRVRAQKLCKIQRNHKSSSRDKLKTWKPKKIFSQWNTNKVLPISNKKCKYNVMVF